MPGTLSKCSVGRSSKKITCLPVTLIGTTDMSELRDLVLDARGIARWKTTRTIEGDMSITGLLWARKDARNAEAALEANGLGTRNSESVRGRGFRSGASGLIAHGLPTGFQKDVRQPLVAGRTREHDRTDHSGNCAGGGLPRI